MLQTVDVGKRSLAAYRGVAPDAILNDLFRHAEPLRGSRVVHINATPYGGGVSELLRSVVPLMNDLGILTDWKVISGDNAFFEVTKKIHNALQGARITLTVEERDTYARYMERNASLFEEAYDYIFIHDPQPAGMLSFRGKGSARWIWRCHIDTADPAPEIWEFIREYLKGYDAAVFTIREFLPPDLPINHVEIIPPAIDPLSPKNMSLPESMAQQILAWMGIEMDRPLITQVSRFDPWKDPMGVIAAYRIARKEIANLQLVLAGSMALDDPEAWDIYKKITSKSQNDPFIHVLTNLTGVGNIEVNALQRLSNIVIQKSIREGFGLVISEALWKGTPVVAGRTGGIPLQTADGAGGILVDTVEECARAIIDLFRNPARKEEFARRGMERVREYFLTPRLLLNHLSLLHGLSRIPLPIFGRTVGEIRRDPVCGMTVEEPAVTSRRDDHTYYFCSDRCHMLFENDPTRYV